MVLTTILNQPYQTQVYPVSIFITIVIGGHVIEVNPIEINPFILDTETLVGLHRLDLVLEVAECPNVTEVGLPRLDIVILPEGLPTEIIIGIHKVIKRLLPISVEPDFDYKKPLNLFDGVRLNLVTSELNRLFTGTNINPIKITATLINPIPTKVDDDTILPDR